MQQVDFIEGAIENRYEALIPSPLADLRKGVTPEYFGVE